MTKGKKFSMGFGMFLIAMIAMSMMVSSGWAQKVPKYEFNIAELEKYKKPIDDPSPFYEKIEGYKKIMPPEVYKKTIYDVEAMKKTWAEVVGFKAPDVVGKVYPEIKPGKYTYQDKTKYPFDKMMWKHMYDRFNPPPKSGARHVGNFTEFEIVPTRQYYPSLPVGEATKKHMGTAKLDDQGYMIEDSYVAGYPFPRPEGKFMAQQIVYNWMKNYNLDQEYYWEHCLGYTKDLRQDYEDNATAYSIRLQGRVKWEPLGWFDDRAKDQKELKVFQYSSLAPRDLFGNVLTITSYIDPNKDDLFLMYINSLRRIRKMTASDMQDPAVGQDMIYEDWQGFQQKLSPKRYPYKFEVVGEGEFLVPITIDGSPYMSSKDGYTIKNLQFERRPCWIVQMTGQDKNYIYGKRIWYVDKEILYLHHLDNYDQKGRLYRTYTSLWGFVPEMGIYNQVQALELDHVDTHSTMCITYSYPALWLTRGDFSMSGLVKAK
jgi:hypothetical protein